MYICICNAVTDTDIKKQLKSVREQCLTAEDKLNKLRDELGVCTGCGTCESYVKEIINE
jgi:bacterioferritin-associated ferredoxin